MGEATFRRNQLLQQKKASKRGNRGAIAGAIIGGLMGMGGGPGGAAAGAAKGASIGYAAGRGNTGGAIQGVAGFAADQQAADMMAQDQETRNLAIGQMTDRPDVVEGIDESGQQLITPGRKADPRQGALTLLKSRDPATRAAGFQILGRQSEQTFRAGEGDKGREFKAGESKLDRQFRLDAEKAGFKNKKQLAEWNNEFKRIMQEDRQEAQAELTDLQINARRRLFLEGKAIDRGIAQNKKPGETTDKYLTRLMKQNNEFGKGTKGVKPLSPSEEKTVDRLLRFNARSELYKQGLNAGFKANQPGQITPPPTQPTTPTPIAQPDASGELVLTKDPGSLNAEEQKTLVAGKVYTFGTKRAKWNGTTWVSP